MNKMLVNLLLISVGMNTLQSLALIGMNEELKKWKDHAIRSDNWSHMMHKLVQSHYRNGGEFLVDPDLEGEVEAYLIMARNGMG